MSTALPFQIHVCVCVSIGKMPVAASPFSVVKVYILFLVCALLEIESDYFFKYNQKRMLDGLNSKAVRVYTSCY